MKKVIDYYLNYRPGSKGRIYFRLEGESTNNVIELPPAEFCALALVLSQKNLQYDPSKGFLSYDTNG